jgi:hypothetical protein
MHAGDANVPFLAVPHGGGDVAERGGQIQDVDSDPQDIDAFAGHATFPQHTHKPAKHQSKCAAKPRK